MKIVDKLAEDFICGCSTCPECHYGDNMDSFKAGYQAAVEELRKLERNEEFEKFTLVSQNSVIQDAHDFLLGIEVED